MSHKFLDLSKIEPMNLRSIRLIEQSTNVSDIVSITETDGFFLDRSFSDDFRIRTPVYDKLKAAKKFLPSGIFFLLFEAYRPLSRQIELWESTLREIKKMRPALSAQDMIALCEYFVANPYDGIGSGHQACCAVDISLCTTDSYQLDMGAEMQEFNSKTPTDAIGITEKVKANRHILKHALESVGFVNYPAEWWHYSYGDHQWAWLLGKTEALFGPLILPEINHNDLNPPHRSGGDHVL